MNNKIVSIFVTLFMLIMCVIAMVTLSLTNVKRTQDQVIERATGSVLSTDGEIREDSGAVIRGSSLISAIIGINAVDNKIPDQREKIYKYTEYDSYGNAHLFSRYTFDFNGDTNETSIVSKIEPNNNYILTYKFKDNGTAIVSIEAE